MMDSQQLSVKLDQQQPVTIGSLCKMKRDALGRHKLEPSQTVHCSPLVVTRLAGPRRPKRRILVETGCIRSRPIPASQQ
jgi:hypothetical protein